MSHTYVHTPPAEKLGTKRKAKPAGGAQSKVKQINSESEMSTLGDLDALSALKAEMEDNTKKANEKKAAAKKKAEAKKEEAPAEEPTAEASEETTEE